MFAFCFLLYLIFLFTQSLTKQLLLDNMKLFITVIYPSLFTSLVFISLAKNSKLLWLFSYRFFPILHKLFHFKYQKSGEILLLSFFCGCPANASLITEAIKNKEIDSEEGIHLTASTSTMSLSYCITILTLFFGAQWFAILLSYFLAHGIFLWLIGLGYNTGKNTIKRKQENLKENFETCFLNSIQTSTNTLLNIFGIMVFFTSISAILLYYFPNYKYFAFLTEICSGITLTPKNPHLILTALSLLGMSVLFQIKKAFNEIPITGLIRDKIIIASIANLIYLIIKGANTSISFSLFYLIPIVLLIFIFITALIVKPKN